MLKVLMTGVSNIGTAGVATIAYNLGQALDNREVKIGYLAQHGLTDEKYKKLIEDRGNKIYIMDCNSEGKLYKTKAIFDWVYRILTKERYDAIHINTDTAYLAAAYLWIAKRARTKYIIVHSHSRMVDDERDLPRKVKIFLHKMCSPYVQKNADVCLACSSQAGKWLFGNRKFTVIPNGIDIDKFTYNERVRLEYRQKMGLDGKFVIVTVGRLAYSKKPCFTVDIFTEIVKKFPESRLLFVGDGPLRQEVQEHVESKKMKEKIQLLGNRDDVSQLLSTADVFLLPSLFEGFGIAYIEAQASGMPVFASDQVPNEAFVTDLIHRCSLHDSAVEWANQIVQHRSDARLEYVKEIMEDRYDINWASKVLESEYLKLEGSHRGNQDARKTYTEEN